MIPTRAASRRNDSIVVAQLRRCPSVKLLIKRPSRMSHLYPLSLGERQLLRMPGCPSGLSLQSWLSEHSVIDR